MAMKNKRKNVSVTTILISIIKQFLMFIRPVCRLVAMSYAVTFGYRHMRKLGAEIVCNAISTGSTFIAILISMHSFIGSGVYYFTLSIEKRLAIIWACDKGDWNHYLLYTELKDNLISQDHFARLLNNLASNSFGKFIQILLLLMCLAILLSLIIIFIQCIKQTSKNVKKANPLK